MVMGPGSSYTFRYSQLGFSSEWLAVCILHLICQREFAKETSTPRQQMYVYCSIGNMENSRFQLYISVTLISFQETMWSAFVVASLKMKSFSMRNWPNLAF